MTLTISSSKVFQELWFQDKGYIFTVRIGQLKCIRIAKIFLQTDFLIYINVYFLCMCECCAWVFGCLCVCTHVCADVQVHGCVVEPEVGFEFGLLYTLYYWGSVLSLKPELTNSCSLTRRFAVVTCLQPPNAGITGRLPGQTSVYVGMRLWTLFPTLACWVPPHRATAPVLSSSFSEVKNFHVNFLKGLKILWTSTPP